MNYFDIPSRSIILLLVNRGILIYSIIQSVPRALASQSGAPGRRWLPSGHPFHFQESKCIIFSFLSPSSPPSPHHFHLPEIPLLDLMGNWTSRSLHLYYLQLETVRATWLCNCHVTYSSQNVTHTDSESSSGNSYRLHSQCDRYEIPLTLTLESLRNYYTFSISFKRFKVEIVT